jgi:hypothetical protein
MLVCIETYNSAFACFEYSCSECLIHHLNPLPNTHIHAYIHTHVSINRTYFLINAWIFTHILVNLHEIQYVQFQQYQLADVGEEELSNRTDEMSSSSSCCSDDSVQAEKKIRVEDEEEQAEKATSDAEAKAASQANVAAEEVPTEESAGAEKTM